MTCEEVERMILSGTVSADGAEHVRHCESCREFQQVLGLVTAADRSCPSSELDARVLATGSSVLRGVRLRRRLGRARWLIVSVAGVAACALVLLGLWPGAVESVSPVSEKPGLTAAVAPSSTSAGVSVQALSEDILASDYALACDDLDDVELALELFSTGDDLVSLPRVEHVSGSLSSVSGDTELHALGDALSEMETMVQSL